MADRRAGRVPHVREDGGGKQPRSRNKSGTWRGKRSDAGKKAREKAVRARARRLEGLRRAHSAS